MNTTLFFADTLLTADQLEELLARAAAGEAVFCEQLDLLLAA